MLYHVDIMSKMKKKLILGISASIAAHKLPAMVEELTGDYDIQVVMTQNSRQFVSPIALEVLSKREVKVDTFNGKHTQVDHVEFVLGADLFVVAPASTNLIGKYANGIADDILTTMLMVMPTEKVIICPAMNENMYSNPIVRANIQKLKAYGVKEVEPVECLLASGKIGNGGLAPLEHIKIAIENELN